MMLINVYHGGQIINTSTDMGYDIPDVCIFSALYQLPHNKILVLVVESEPISASDNYDPTSIIESSNPVMAEERTHSRAREQLSSHAPVQNVDEDNEEEDWHLDVEDDDIHDETDINMDEIEYAIDVKEIVKEWKISVPFIN
jgi:hypothetical protein